MKNIFLMVLILFVFIIQVEAAPPTRTYTYTTGQTIDPSQVTTNEDNLYNYFSSGVENIAADSVVSSDILDGTIVNADLSASAAIALSKISFTTDITLTGTTPSITIGDAGEEDTQINFDGNAQDYHIGLDDTDDDFKIGLGTVLGTTPYLVISEAGEVTKPSQPSFLVNPSIAQSNMATATTLVFGTEVYDTGGDFASNTFTAPVTGKYLLSISVNLNQLDNAVSDYDVAIVTSNRTYSHEFDASKFSADLTAEWGIAFSVVADMDSSDTAYVQYNQSGGTAQVDCQTGSYFSGALLL